MCMFAAPEGMHPDVFDQLCSFARWCLAVSAAAVAISFCVDRRTAQCPRCDPAIDHFCRGDSVLCCCQIAQLFSDGKESAKHCCFLRGASFWNREAAILGLETVAVLVVLVFTCRAFVAYTCVQEVSTAPPRSTYCGCAGRWNGHRTP
jgi:hypothetical protein